MTAQPPRSRDAPGGWRRHPPSRCHPRRVNDRLRPSHHLRLAQYGIKRLVRHLWKISGSVLSSDTGQVVETVLKQAAPLAAGVVTALRVLLGPEGIAVSLGEN